MTGTLRLPGHIDSNAAPPLAAQILEKSGQPLTLDASGVTFIGALGLQVLIAAKKQWDADETAFAVDHLGDEMMDACKALGVTGDAFGASMPTPQFEEQTV